MSIIREEIRGLIAEYTGLGFRGIVDSGSTTTAVDAGLASYSKDWREGTIVYFYYDAGGAGAAPEDTYGSLTDFDRDTGTVTFVPALTAPAVGDKYELWEPEVEHIDHVNEAINRALTQHCYYYALIPLTILTDGDCQANTGWSVSAGTKASVLVATAFAYPYRLGRFYLAWTATTAADYFYQNLEVQENRNWQIGIIMRTAAATTATVTVYDVTNSAAITTSGDTLAVTGLQASGSPWQYLKAQFTVPNNCDRISVRIANGTTGGVTHVAAVMLWPSDTYALPLPDRVKGESSVRRVFQVVGDLDIDYPESWDKREITSCAIRQQAIGGLSVVLPGRYSSTYPLFYEERSFYDSLNDDDATTKTGTTRGTTDCKDEYVGWMASWLLMQRVARRQTLLHGREEAQKYRELEGDILREANTQAGVATGGSVLVMRRQ